MLKIFRHRICEEINGEIERLEANFVKYKSASNKLIFSRKYGEILTSYLEFQFYSDRDYVIPNLYWSKLNRLPSEDCVPLGGFTDYIGNLQVLDVREEIMLTACEFGLGTNAFNLAHSNAPFEKLEKLYDSDIGKRVSNEMTKLGLKNWRSEAILQSWGMLDELFPGSIDEHDILYATRALVDEIKDLLNAHYLPYLEQFENRQAQ